MNNWKEYKLGEIGNVITGNTPSKNNPKHWGDDMPFVTPTDFDSYNKNIWDSIRYLSQEGINAFQKKVLPVDSIIVTCIGSQMGKVAINKKECVTNQQINSIIPHKEFNSDFIYYVLSSMQDFLRNLATGGSTMPIVNKTSFEEITISIPDLPTQTAIAEILSSLDDKIELNNKINQELENLAQTLFKQWFIDFEFPNENGEPYKSSGGEMVDSELGVIPKWWEVERLGDHLYIKGRIGWKGLKKSEYLQEFEGYSIVNGSDFLNEQIDYNTCGWIPKDRYDDSPEIQLQQNDILITKDGTIGKLAFVNKIEHPTSVASGVFVVRPNSKNVRTYFCWSFFKSPYFQSLVKSRIDGSVIPHLYQKDFVEMFIPLPPLNLLEAFEIQAESLFELIFENKEEAKELSKLRDTLLPKLITGELQVNELD